MNAVLNIIAAIAAVIVLIGFIRFLRKLSIRAACDIAIWAVSLVLLTIVSYAVVGFLDNRMQIDTSSQMEWGVVVGLSIWLFFFGWSLGHLIINPPGQKGWRVKNPWTGKVKAFPNGYWCIFPGEQVMLDGEFPMIRMEVAEDAERSYTSSDNNLLFSKWRHLFEADPDNLDTFIKYAPDVIQAQIKANNNRILSDLCRTYKADDAVGAKEKMSKFVTDSYNDGIFARLYGIKLEGFIMSDIDKDPDLIKLQSIVSETESDAEAAEKIMARAKRLGQNMTFEKALESVFIINGRLTPQQITAKGLGKTAILLGPGLGGGKNTP